ncbi:MAG: O-antigen ligase family protein [bacterium]|nr:O-antigen ligase family protein [bacterium]
MTRLWVIFCCALFTFAGAITAVFATLDEQAVQLRGVDDPLHTLDLPFRIPRPGVNADLTQYAPAQLDVVLSEMRASGVVWVRQFVRWGEIEPRPGQRNWAEWDAIMTALADYPELELLPVFFTVPEWARVEQAVDHPSAPPADPTVYAAFVGAFAARYGGQISAYQLWDEPNLREAWGGQEPRPAEYAALVGPAADAIRSADPDAQILAAALAPTVESGPQNLSDLLYLDGLYALEVDQKVDGFAAKPYGFDRSPLDRTVDGGVLNFSRVIALREIMQAQQDGTKPLWISEYGWNALPQEWTGSPSVWGSVTTSQQIEYTQQAIHRAESEWAWLGGMILAHWQPNASADDPRWGFSLTTPDGAPTPLRDVLQAAEPTQAAGHGLHAAASPFAAYSGVWTFSDIGADIGWIQDSQLAFTFSGRAVGLVLRQGAYEAYLYPALDHTLSYALPLDADGRPFINLKSDRETSSIEIVRVSTNLPPGVHTLRAAADRGWDQWALVGYAVRAGDLAAPYRVQTLIAVLAALVTGAAAFITALQLDFAPAARHLSRLLTGLGSIGQLGFSLVTSLAVVIGVFITWNDATPALFRREPVQLGLGLLTAGLVYLEPGLILTLAGCAGLFVVIYHRLEIGLMLTLFYAPFFLFPVELLLFAFPMSELVMLITGAAWLLRNLVEMHKQPSIHAASSTSLTERLRHLSALDWTMLAWAALGIVSLLWTEYRASAFTELRALILEPVLFYVILRSLRHAPSVILRLVDMLLAAGAVVCIVGLFMFITGTGAGVITAEGGAARLASVYGSPNNVALFLGRCIPFAFAFALVKVDKQRRVFGALLTGLFTGTLILTLSAGGIFIGLPAGVGAVLILLYGRRSLTVLAGLGVIGGIGAAVASTSARFARLLDFTEGTNFFRIRVWQSAWQMIQDRPLTGFGLDQFLYFFRGRYMLPDAWQEPNLSHPHNILLDYWTRLGLLGVALLVLTQVAFWRAALRVYRAVRTRNPFAAALTIGIMGCMVNLLAHGLVDNSVFVHDLTYIFVLMIGGIETIRTSELLTTPTK